MPKAVSLAAYNSTGEQIERLWREVAKLEDAPSMEQLNYVPHITLGIWQTIEPEYLERALNAVFADSRAVPVEFDRIRYFESDPLVLWASPIRSEALSRIHREIHEHLNSSACHEHYQVGNWVPHCTLGTRVKRSMRDAALTLISEKFETFEVTFDFAEWVIFPPVEVLGRVSLKTD